MVNEFFPYRYQDNGVTLQVTDVTVDGVARPEVIQAESTMIDLTDRPTWQVIDFEVKVQINSQMVELVLPPYEREATPWHVVLVAASVMGNAGQIGWRQSEQLTPTKSDKLDWRGRVRLNHDDTGTLVHLRAFVTRSTPASTPQRGYADESGLRFGASEEWTVQIDPRRIPPGKSMRVEWINFRTCDKQILNEISDSLYYLDLDQDTPVLYLNEDVPDFKTVLSAQGYVGPRAAIRDALFHSIAQPVWTSLSILAASTECDDEGERPEWKESVLQEIAPYVYPGESEEAAVKHLITDGCDPNSRSVLFQKLLPAVQSYLELRKSTLRLLRDVLSID